MSKRSTSLSHFKCQIGHTNRRRDYKEIGEKRKEDATELTKLKNKFEDTKSKKVELEQVKAAAESEKARLFYLYIKEKFQIPNVTRGIKVANSAISEVIHQAILKSQHIASKKPEAERWSTILAKARHDKEVPEQNWKILQNQLPFL